MLMFEGRGDTRCCHMQDSQTALEEAMKESPALDSRRLRWGAKTGDWLAMLMCMVNGMNMWDQE